MAAYQRHLLLHGASIISTQHQPSGKRVEIYLQKLEQHMVIFGFSFAVFSVYVSALNKTRTLRQDVISLCDAENTCYY